MSSGTPGEKKSNREGIGGWMSSRGLIAKVSFAFIGTIFILIIIMGAGYYTPNIQSPETLTSPEGIPNTAITPDRDTTEPRPLILVSPLIAKNQSVVTLENVATDIPLLEYDDYASNMSAARIISPPSKGSLSDINQSTGVVTYTPNQGYIGTDRFTFKVNNGVSDNNTATVSIRIFATKN